MNKIIQIYLRVYCGFVICMPYRRRHSTTSRVADHKHFSISFFCAAKTNKLYAGHIHIYVSATAQAYTVRPSICWFVEHFWQLTPCLSNEKINVFLVAALTNTPHRSTYLFLFTSSTVCVCV